MRSVAFCNSGQLVFETRDALLGHIIYERPHEFIWCKCRCHLEHCNPSASLFDTRAANNLKDPHAHLSSDQFLVLRTGMREDILQLCECLVLRLRQKDKSKSTSQDGCESLHPIECHISLYVTICQTLNTSFTTV